MTECITLKKSESDLQTLIHLGKQNGVVQLNFLKRSTDTDSPRQAKWGRPAKLSQQCSRYPIMEDSPLPDKDLDNRNYQALILECARDKPRKDLVIQLMRDTCKL